MSSGLISCPKCTEEFSILSFAKGKIGSLDEPWTCSYCKAKIVRDKEKGYGLKELSND